MLKATPLEYRIAEITRDALTAEGFRLVNVSYGSVKNEGEKLIITIERLDGIGLNIKDCTAAAEMISLLLDVEDPIVESYRLEVTSPGADRPLNIVEDFERFIGFEAKLRTSIPTAEGRRNWRGHLVRTDSENQTVTIVSDAAEVTFTLAELESARMVATNDFVNYLVKQAEAQQTAANQNKNNTDPKGD